jgi:hypothetical protein
MSDARDVCLPGERPVDQSLGFRAKYSKAIKNIYSIVFINYIGFPALGPCGLPV